MRQRGARQRGARQRGARLRGARQRGARAAIALAALVALVACDPPDAMASAGAALGSLAGAAASPSTSAAPGVTVNVDLPADAGGVRTLLVIAIVSGVDKPVVDFSPIYASKYLVPAPAEPPGDFSIVVWNGKAKVTEVSFSSPPTYVADCDTPDCAGPQNLIGVRVPIGDAAYTRVELLHLGGSIGFVDASKHAPVVGNVAIGPGPTGGDIVTFDASDADGDALSSIVTYSTDGGATWEVLSDNQVGGFISTEPAVLPPAPGLMVRVEVSDGVLSASAAGGPFGSSNTAPEVWGVSELDASAFISGNGTLQISMVGALDNNHSMPSSALSWASSIDGTIQSGGGLFVRASELSEGLHVITVTATDEQGATGAWSGVLRVQREYTDAPAPPITDAETVALFRTLAGQRGLQPTVAGAVEAAIAALKTALSSGKASGVCAAFGAIGDPEAKPGPALAGADHDDAGSLAGLAEVLGAPHGCTPD